MNSTQGPPPETTNALLHELVLSLNVHSQPDVIAVASWDGSLTYAALDRASNAFAQVLKARGATPNAFVPICSSKSKWSIVALLGILKAGAAFVPIDAGFPDERCLELLRDVGAKAMVVSPEHSERFRKLDLVDVVVICPETAPERHQNETEQARHVEPADAAYALYTSGSTGKPKAVVMEHRAVCSALPRLTDAFLCTPQSRMLQFASFTFDVCIGEIFATLFVGGCICVPSEEQRVNNLTQAMRDLKVNQALLTPSLIKLIRHEELPLLETLVSGGEPMTQTIVSEWAPRVALINAYGPTETCVCSVSKRMAPDYSSEDVIGLPVACRTWIANPENYEELVSDGQPGELLIEGPTLARGYLNDPEKTVSAFIYPSWLNGERAYKTGDVVQINRDGSLSYIGRKDSQVKLHGQRVELGEIEHHVSIQSGIQLVIATVPKKGIYKERLITVVQKQSVPSAHQHHQVHLSEELQATIYSDCGLESSLRRVLPRHMIPNLWLSVESMPFLPSGKIDRKAIVESLEKVSRHDQPNEEGVNDSRCVSTVKAALSQVVSVPEKNIAKEHAFCHYGIDSLSAIEVVAKCRSAGLLLTVEAILHGSSIDSVASEALDMDTGDVRCDEKPTTEWFGLSPVQAMYFHFLPWQKRFHSQLLLRCARKSAVEEVRAATETLVKQHDMLRARFSKDSGRWMQRCLSREQPDTFEFSSHSLVGSDISTVVSQCHENINILNGPVISVAVLTCAETGKQLISLVAHHLVIDLVSWRTIIKDLDQLLSGKTLEERRPPSFRTVRDLQADYGRDAKAGNLIPTEIAPAWREFWGPVSNPISSYVQHRISIDASQMTLLMETTRAVNAELTDLLLAALLTSFYEVFPERKERPLSIWTQHHGRVDLQDLDPTGTVGWMTTFVPVYAPPSKVLGLTSTAQELAWFRRETPGRGLPFFLSKFSESQGMQELGEHEVLFNFVGHENFVVHGNEILTEQLDVEGVSELDTEIRLSTTFTFNVVTKASGELSISLGWSRNLLHQQRLLRWIEVMEQELVLPVHSFHIRLGRSV